MQFHAFHPMFSSANPPLRPILIRCRHRPAQVQNVSSSYTHRGALHVVAGLGQASDVSDSINKLVRQLVADKILLPNAPPSIQMSARQEKCAPNMRAL